MTPDYVDEIIGLIDITDWVGEDDFGYSLATLPATEISPELWAQLEPSPRHTHLLATITSYGHRAVISVTEEAADAAFQTSWKSYEVWLDSLYADESE